MLDRIQSNAVTGYFSQAVLDYAKKMRPTETKKEAGGKTIAEFTDKEWDKLLSRVDDAIDEYKADLKEREEEALDKKREQTENYILGKDLICQEEYEQTVLQGKTVQSMRFMKITDSMRSNDTVKTEKPDIINTISDIVSDEAIQRIIGVRKNAPYSALADENGMVKYNDVIFQCDYENNRLCLGDVSNMSNCISVPLENGGCLVFNRDSIDALSAAIGMFSPEDVNRILRAIAQDTKLRQMEQEIEDEASGMEVLDKKEEEHES